MKLKFLRYFYSAFFYLILPLLFLRLVWRSRRNPGYRKRMLERLGFTRLSLDKSIWIHAVSVGESIIAVSLVKKLRLLYPELPIVVTTMTPTGAARIVAGLGDSVYHRYVPYDLPGAVRRFLKDTRPLISIVMETELWPNFFALCSASKIPVVIANGRLSPRSAKGYQRIAGTTGQMLNSLSLLMAQSQADADRFIALGMDPNKVVVTGNIKFDLELAADLISRAEVLRMHLGQARPVWIAASTHGGEEDIVLAAHRLIVEKMPEALLVLVPRHPERFNGVAELIAEKGFQGVRRSQGATCDTSVNVYLGDTMGEMMLLYAAADVALVAGSFAQVGGHNLLEPAALAKPVLSGPVLFNFVEISELLKEADALSVVANAEDLAEAVLACFMQPQRSRLQGERALKVVEKNRGALAKHVDLLASILMD